MLILVSISSEAISIFISDAENFENKKGYFGFAESIAYVIELFFII
jgi:hypothetical protein